MTHILLVLPPTALEFFVPSSSSSFRRPTTTYHSCLGRLHSLFLPTTAKAVTMGKSKSTKPFIDKKNASTYSLLHRSQRDVAEDVLSSAVTPNSNGMVLWPSPSNNRDMDEIVLGGNSVMMEWKQKLAVAGLLDPQDSELFMKEITGSGTFLGRAGRVEDPLNDPRTQRREEETLLEIDRQLDSIPLTAEVMDDDIAAALFGEEEEFEELNDDFVFMAAADPTDEEDAFDFDRHIQDLLEKARRDREDRPPSVEHSWGRRDDEFFSKLQPLHEQAEDDSIFHTPGVVSKLSPEEERALCERFEATLAEYDSDEMGDCDIVDDAADDADYAIHADDEKLDAVLDDFLLDKEDDVLIYGKDMRRIGGSGFHNTGDATACDQQPVTSLHEVLAYATETLAEPLHAPPPEDVLIDGLSYFSLKDRNPWDCESILTTYSNLDNNPVVIGATLNRRRKTKHFHEGEAKECVQKIELSNKTGLPLVALTEVSRVLDGDTDTFRSVNRGEARGRNETAIEKKARKFLVKQERQQARITKKVTREIYQEEFGKRAPMVVDELACKAVFQLIPPMC
jgi:protein LTV1